MENIYILLISSNKNDAENIKEIFSGIKNTPYGLIHVNSISEGVERLKSGGVDIVVLELFLSDSKGIETFDKIKDLVVNMPMIILTGKKDEDLAIKCIDNGANDYLIKEDLTANLLSKSISYAMERNVLMVELKQYAQELLVNEEYFKNLIASNVDSMVVIDNNHIVRFVNSAAEQFFCKSSADMIGKEFEYNTELDKTLEVSITQEGGKVFVAEMRVVKIEWEREPAYLASLRDITIRKQTERERIKLIRELQDALAQVKALSGLLPICAVCKKIRDDKGYWNQLEGYIQDHSSAEFSHGICPDCQKKLYSDTIQEK